MNYKKELKKFNINLIATMSLVMFIVPLIICGSINIFALNNKLLLTGKVYWDILIVLVGLVFGVVLHELLHALGGIIAGKLSTKDIKFGMNLKQGLFYCHLSKAMKVSQYRFVLLLPVVITGIIPLIICTIFGNIFMVLLFCFMVSGGAGDIIMFFSLMKEDKDTKILDHSSAPAFYLLYPEDKLPENFVECTEEMEKELIASMSISPYSTKKGDKKNPIIKVLLIASFLALVVLGVFLVALVLKFV